VRLKVITTLLCKKLSGDPFDVLATQAERISKLARDSTLSEAETLSLQSTLTFILTTAVKFAVGEDVLSTELQQLGLPAENAEAVGRGLRENREGLVRTLRMKFVMCEL
jgi:hypothetical protein